MQLITPENWAVIHVGLIFMITCTLMVIVYVLSDSSNPIPGLGLYTVYFMAALLGWIAYTLKQVADIPMPVDVPSVAAILNSYLGDYYTCCVPSDEWEGTYDKMKKWANESRIRQWVLDKAAAAGD